MGAKCCKCEDNSRVTNFHEEHQMTSLEPETFSSIPAEELADSEPQPPRQPPRQPARQPARQPTPTPPPSPPRQLTHVIHVCKAIF